ncbi:hypothetical protein [uncultured Tenacibaculum sp.]|uniref:hypothetical protein n=1 Tax=uncultured Tenacibaculum sp. TaxID=174713 RepID=UPI0026319ABB|nr:hypothetical protein [uncultured Tenacibaculum sp.]
MYLFYVYGSGLGHLTRVRNFIHTKNISLKECVIITNSSYKNYFPKTAITIFKDDIFFTDNYRVKIFLNRCVQKYAISTFVTDVFYAGFYGELNDFFNQIKGLKLTLLARILNSNYSSKYNCIVYDTVYLLEQGIFLDKYNYKHKENLTLISLSKNNTKSNITIVKPYFLVLHSGPLEEVILLYKQALLYRKNEHICIQTYIDFPVQYLKEKTTLICKEKTNNQLLENAKKIFSGCGFNSSAETLPYRKKQHVIPFKRRYDDQFKRKSMQFLK